jgi:hypothetical protein
LKYLSEFESVQLIKAKLLSSVQMANTFCHGTIINQLATSMETCSLVPQSNVVLTLSVKKKCQYKFNNGFSKDFGQDMQSLNLAVSF